MSMPSARTRHDAHALQAARPGLGATDLRRELALTVVGLTVTVAAALLAGLDVATVLASRINGHDLIGTIVQAFFLGVVAFMVYGACVYLVTRLGHLRRLRHHSPALRTELEEVYQEAHPPAFTALVPSYREDPRVVRRTLICAALQEYPRRRIVLLIDDPPSPTNEADAAILHAARALPLEIEALLAEPLKRCEAALEAFLERQMSPYGSAPLEYSTLAELCDEIGEWFEEQAYRYEIVDHADRFFVEATFRGPARECRDTARRLRRAAWDSNPQDDADIGSLRWVYGRLVSRFEADIVSFERKRYDNLSHAANKAMNLNSYIGLLGGRFREAVQGPALILERATTGRVDITIPTSEFLLVIDADSVVMPDYALRLIHLMRTPGNERLAITQTPYSAFPGAPGAVEQVAGATTDIQYLIHQGFTQFGGTYWVGANAIVRTAALADIATAERERGYTITRFIQDRTVIEDTESTVDLRARGWHLHNYPERLAYSETPPDFGSLLVQRRRWANGGLIILPKLLRYLAADGRWRRHCVGAAVMVHYLTSLAAINLGLLIVLAFSFEDSMRTAWLPLTAVPYYVLYARDLKLIGRRVRDVVRVYAMNLVLIPVNLAGIFNSVRQMVTGKKTPFGRTPKVQGRTRVPWIYLVATYGLLAQWCLLLMEDVMHERPLHGLLVLMNITLFVYGIAVFIGLRRSVDDLRAAFAAARRPDTA